MPPTRDRSRTPTTVRASRWLTSATTSPATKVAVKKLGRRAMSRGTPSRTTTNGKAKPISSPNPNIHNLRSTITALDRRGSQEWYDVVGLRMPVESVTTVSYTHLRAHETRHDLV